ncbi:MAG: hypothetical protein A2145_03010 [candidate division Zixibacteria bacterium RBG_16_40_9]|nr:MAG: hypothetical protein A2145_03010 [candidate division Zixibacteria bacterium RBG_16_40_9]
MLFPLHDNKSEYSNPEFQAFKKKFQRHKFSKQFGRLAEHILTMFSDMVFCDSILQKSDTTIAFLRKNVPTIIQEDVMDEFKSPEELDQQQKYEEKLSQEIAARVLSISALKLFDWQSGWMTPVAAGKSFFMPAWGFGESSEIHETVIDPSKMKDILFKTQTDLGDVIVSGYGSNQITGSPALVIDLGGNDLYELSYDSTHSVQVIIDLGGDDVYKAQTDFALASGFFGAGILIDEEGDDTYLGKNFSLGSGLFGVGILIDKKGNDKYFGDTYTQGAGGWGIGILEDSEGSDSYNGALFSQGFGFVAGCGFLFDQSGNDNYFAGGKYKDILRYKDHYLSLSQGFAYGIRPYMSGGIGLLFDCAGNDTYNADIFAQGTSYWWGWGGLYDKEGNDYYSCYQYAQGCGTHMTLGTLVDAAGDDIYRVNGVGQGCGHDYSAGILFDKGGNDNYYANGLSQGAGNANGFGILIDRAGDDGYYVKDKSNTQGYGNPRREFGSIGLFLDLKGKDSYFGNGSEGSWWSTGSKWGCGLDLKERDLAEYLIEPETITTTERYLKALNLPALHMADWDKVIKFVNQPENESLKVLVDSLFIQATAINVEHADKVEPAKKTLREMKENSVAYLVKKLNSRDAREIQTLVDILGKMPEATLPVAALLGDLRNEDNWRVRNACRVLGELKDTAAVPYLIDVLNHPDYQVRGYALTAIGNTKDNSAFNWVALALADSVEVVRKSSVYALGELQNERGVDYLIYALDDPHYSVRMAAVEGLGKIGEKAVKQLESEFNNSHSPDKKLLCISALGKTKSEEASEFLWRIYGEQDWRGKGVIVEALGESDNVKNMVRLNSLKEKERHPYLVGKLEQMLAKYKTSK